MDQMLTLNQHARLLPADMVTPISLFASIEQPGILLESAEVDGRWGRYSVLVTDIAVLLRCVEGKLSVTTTDDRLKSLMAFDGRDFVEGLRSLLSHITILPPKDYELPPITRALYGYFGFGMAALFCERLAKTMPIHEAECTLVLPATILVFDHLYNRLCQISLGEHTPLSTTASLQEEPSSTFNITQSPSPEGYMDMVKTIRNMLTRGDAIQVVPSVRFKTPFSGNPFTLYRRMRSTNPSPYMFYMHFPDQTLFGSSPEVMVRCQKNALTLSPIAGTRPRGRDAREDDYFASELLHDPKERAEHVMLVDLGRNDLGRIAKPGSVTVERSMNIERFSHVMHITSTIKATLKDSLDALDVLAATFPAGTVSGAPKVRAMEIIRILEGRSRGPYAGAIGWIGLDHDSVNCDLGIAIRSMWLKDKTLFWQAGGGIVFDSDPEREWMEVYNKSAIMRLALQTKEYGHVLAHR